jgi:hypothetical protein
MRTQKRTGNHPVPPFVPAPLGGWSDPIRSLLDASLHGATAVGSNVA